jgi:hypothetical protein
MPRRKRTALAVALVLTNAKAIVRMPKQKVQKGSHLPGPKCLHAMFEGISNTILREAGSALALVNLEHRLRMYEM